MPTRPPSPPRVLALACAACAALLCARGAHAQLSASVAIDSDYRFRGVSLGGGRPSVRAEAAYDAPRGWYAGASVARAEFAGGDRYTQFTAYGGHVTPLAPALDLDTGLGIWRFSGGGYDFAEAYAGVLGREWSVRVNYSPDYFHEHLSTVYVDFNVHHQLTDTWRVFAHLGELVRVSSAPPSDPSDYANGSGAVPSRRRTDLRAGIGWAVKDNVDLQLAWDHATRRGPVPTTRRGGRAAWVGSATWSF